MAASEHVLLASDKYERLLQRVKDCESDAAEAPDRDTAVQTSGRDPPAGSAAGSRVVRLLGTP